MRPAGPDYEAPWSVANIAYCPGEVTEIPDEKPFDYWVIFVDEVRSFDDELTKDRSLFLRDDFSKYDIIAEILADAQWFPYAKPEKKQVLHRYTYLKKNCQEMQPDFPTTPYGDPFAFFEIQGEPEVHHETSEFEYRHEWRAYFDQTLNLKVKEPLEEIMSAEEREASRADYWKWRAEAA